MSVLILGNKEDDHVRFVRSHCPGSIIIDLSDPSNQAACWNLGAGDSPELLFDNFMPRPDSIRSVYWRSVDIPGSSQFRATPRNLFGYVKFVLDCYRHCAWFNDIQSFCAHVSKPGQLNEVKNIGITIPPTIVTSSANAAKWFVLEHGVIAIKPVSGGDYTRRVDRHNADELLPIIFASGIPMTVQRFVNGPNVRTYVIGENVYSAVIESILPDFRIDTSAIVRPISTSSSVREKAIAIMKCLGLRWTAIDWIIGADGEYYFLEANFSPMFTAFCAATGYALADDFCSALLAAES